MEEKKEYEDLVRKVRKEHIAIEKEEYIEGIRALAVPLRLRRPNLKMAIWAVGLKCHIQDEVITAYSDFIKEIAERIENTFVL